ncbi:MAG: sulfurtransferase [Omnitrophica WOR_2 bacterium]
MAYTTLVSAPDLFQHIEDSGWVIVDCRFSLADKERGRRDYQEAHIPGAVYAHLDEDLSGLIIQGVTGRHPLPVIDKAIEKFSNWGIGTGVQVMAYDDTGGALAAVRLWWMLRWLGHEAAAVLDGGWQEWQRQGYPVRSGVETRSRREFISIPHPEKIVNADQVDVMRKDPGYKVVDARTADRYSGINETVDPVAGHIPGAINAPYMDNLTPAGLFRPADELRQVYQSLLGDIPAQNTAFYCGSGVTSIHDILAMVIAGMDEPPLYVGSWSEWITDPDRPIAP